MKTEAEFEASVAAIVERGVERLIEAEARLVFLRCPDCHKTTPAEREPEDGERVEVEVYCPECVEVFLRPPSPFEGAVFEEVTPLSGLERRVLFDLADGRIELWAVSPASQRNLTLAIGRLREKGYVRYADANVVCRHPKLSEYGKAFVKAAR